MLNGNRTIRLFITVRTYYSLLVGSYFLGISSGVLIFRRITGLSHTSWWLILAAPATVLIGWVLPPGVHWIHDAVVILRSKIRARLSSNLR